MKNIVKIITLLLLFSLCTYAGQTASIIVNTKVVNPHKISKYLNGGFIELLADYTNGFGGMWAQEIEDRGFEEVYNNRTVYYHWTRWFANNEDKGLVEIVLGGYNKLDSNQLMITNAEKTESGMYQKIYLNDEISHDFYIYVKGENTNGGIAKIVFFDTNFTQRIYEKEIDVTATDWTKIAFEIPSIPNVYTVNFMISYKGPGKIYFDEVSLVPTNNFHGIRKEWADFIRLWKPGILRYPGGSFLQVLNQRWEFGIGHIDQRKSDVAGLGKHDNYSQRFDFGNEEYMKICKEFNIEPFIVTNAFRPAEEEVNYVEYCNGDTNTFWGKKRAANGHPEPYNVKYWEIGNEMYFTHSPKEYAPIFNERNDLMKSVDPSIITITNGDLWNQNFDSLMALVGEKTDIFGYHPCGGRLPQHLTPLDRTYLSIMALTLENFIIEWEDKIKKHYPHCKLASTEWWTSYGDRHDWLLDTNNRNASLEAALWSSLQYLTYMRNPQIMTLAARTMGIGLIRRSFTSEGKKIIYATPALSSLAMVSNRRGDYIVSNTVNCETYYIDFPLEDWANTTKYLDVTTSIKEDSLYITVLNRHPQEAIKTSITLDITPINNMAKIYEFTSNHFLDYVTPDEPEKIKPTEKDVNIAVDNDMIWHTFPKHSLTVIAIPIKWTHIDPAITDNTVLYPNPAKNCFYVKLESEQRIKNICIYNSIGQVVYSATPNFYTDLIYINDINLPKGAYKLKLETVNLDIYKELIIE